MMTLRHNLCALFSVSVLCLPGVFADEQNLPPGVVRVRDVNESRWLERTLDSEAVDWSLYPKAYGVLASERLMSPVDLSDWPVKVDAERQLFLDNFIVASAANVKRTVHQPTKHPANPVMTAEQPWEVKDRHIVLQVLYDQETSKFRMWYTTRLPDRGVGRNPTLYAESTDGVHWHRPKLGLLEHNGSKDNNWVCRGRMHGLMYHPDAEDPNRRYLAAIGFEIQAAPYEGLYLYASPDGLRWTQLRKRPIIPFTCDRKTHPLQGLGDTSIVRWDPKLKCYVCDAKMVHGRRGPEGDYEESFRTRGVTTSEDLIHWTTPRMTIYPDALDGPDAQIYANIAFPYESQWIGLLRMYRFDRTGYKQVDVELTSSRDGLNWSRVGNREIFLPLGGQESWDRDYTDVAHNGPLLVNDELWFFYRGSQHLIVVDDYKFAMGLAKLRRDGFVSIDARDETGTVVTRPLTLAGGTLHVNAAASGGRLKVGLAGMDGKPLPDYGVDDCVALTGDSTDQVVQWNGNSDLSPARKQNEHVRLQFELANAALYSFWVE